MYHGDINFLLQLRFISSLSHLQFGFQGVYGESRRDKPRIRHHGLTQKMKQEMKEAFDLFDTDGNGM